VSIAHVIDGVTDLDAALFNPIIDAVNASTLYDEVSAAGFFNVMSEEFGALGDGSTNDRAAIQDAIDAAVLAGGGVVWFPGGFTYKVQITQTGDDTHCLTVDGDNITLAGGPGAVIDCFPYGGDPDVYWQVIDASPDTVWRGGGIFITGGANYGARRRNVQILDLEIDGNFTFTGDHGGADISTGDGWDTTHKGVWFENDLYHDNHAVRRCHIHNFSGELIYSGGASAGATPVLGTFVVEDNHLHDCNGTIVSVGGQWVRVMNNDVHTGATAIENATDDGWHEYAYNRARACGLDAIGFISFGEGIGGADIHHNRVTECTQYGIALFSAWNCKVHHNTIIDCIDGGIRQEVGSGYPNDWSQDVAIYDNLILADHENVGVGISFGFDTAQVRRNRVMRNTISRTEYAADNSKIIAEPYTDFPNTDHGQIDCRENNFYGTHGDNRDSTTYNELLSGTSPTNVVTFKPPTETTLIASVSYRVIVGATNVTVKIHGQDALDVTTTFIAQALTSQAVGSYFLPSYLIPMYQRGTCAVEVTAGTANQVYVTATIREA
jgi:hypothetical protein